jgi:hypothetical protein
MPDKRLISVQHKQRICSPMSFLFIDKCQERKNFMKTNSEERCSSETGILRHYCSD